MAGENKLGKRVTKYREQLGLTQEQLAINSGLELSLIGDIESGAVYPPVGNIIRLSRALGQRVGTFMDDQFVPDPIVVRKSKRVEEASSDTKEGHYEYYPLGKGKTDRHMEPLFIRIGEEEEDKKMSVHEGEEFIIVVTGKVIVKYGTTEQILEEGDSAYYNSVVPHYIGAVGGPAEIYAVMYTPM